MPTKFYGLLSLSAMKRGAIAKGKKIGIHKRLTKAGSFDFVEIVETRMGEILSVKKTKNWLHITAKFKKRNKKKIQKKKIIQMIMQSVDFKRKNLERLFTKMFYLNFTEQDLERILKNKAKFELPRAFLGKEAGEEVFLKVKGKYYEI